MYKLKNRPNAVESPFNTPGRSLHSITTFQLDVIDVLASGNDTGLYTMPLSGALAVPRAVVAAGAKVEELVALEDADEDCNEYGGDGDD
jgi:hypothetical protein